MMTPLGDVYEKTDGTTWTKRANIAGPPTQVPLVTSLPASPIDGQECYFFVETGIIWHLRYTASIADAYKWIYVGGGPIVRVATNRIGTTSNGVPVEVAGSGLDINPLPLAGFYEAECHASSFSNQVAYVYMQWAAKNPAGTVLGGFGAWRFTNTNVYGTGHVVGRYRTPAMPVGSKIVTEYCGQAGNDAYFDARALACWPVRVG